MKKLSLHKTAKIAAALLGALPFAAQASHSDDFTIWDGNGNIVEQVIVTEAEEIANGANHIYTLNTNFDLSQVSNFTSLYDDPAHPTTSIGDIFGIGQVGRFGFLSFSSGTENTLPYGGSLVGPGGNFYEGSAASFDATRYLAKNLRDAGWTAAFRSDNALNGIPEPTSLSLLAIGVLGLFGTSKRKQASA